MLATVLLMGCDAITSVRGVVRDQNGQPLAEASVKLLATRSGRTAQRSTAADGFFSVEIIHGVLPGPFRLEISKNGYVTFTQDIKAKSRQEITVVLARDESNPKL